MIIKNGEVFQEDGSFRLQDLYVENHRIVASEDEVTDKTIVDAAGLRVLPGLVDIHSHGAFGHDFSDADPEGLKIILKYEKSHGITSYCPTSMTLPAEELKEIFATIKTVGEMKDGAAVRGINPLRSASSGMSGESIWKAHFWMRRKKAPMWRAISANQMPDFSVN